MVIFKNKAFSLLVKAFAILLIGVILLLMICYAVLNTESKFAPTYQSVIQRKYDKLINTKDKKIVIVGGSNAGFGIDSVLLEEITGYPVVNMGLHAGFGSLYNTEIAKRHVNKDDILILAYEYGIKSENFESLGDINLIMAAMDGRLDMYKEIPLKNMPEILGNVFKFAKYKRNTNSNPKPTDVYGSASFDEMGNMTYKRNKCYIVDYDKRINTYGAVYGNDILPENDEYKYLKDLNKYITKRGASVYLTSAVLLDDAYHGTEQELLDYAKELEKRTGIKFISNPNDYLFPIEYMYDTIYHCNDMGEKERTRLLAEDLIKNGIIK